MMPSQRLPRKIIYSAKRPPSFKAKLIGKQLHYRSNRPMIGRIELASIGVLIHINEPIGYLPPCLDKGGSGVHKHVVDALFGVIGRRWRYIGQLLPARRQ